MQTPVSVSLSICLVEAVLAGHLTRTGDNIYDVQSGNNFNRNSIPRPVSNGAAKNSSRCGIEETTRTEQNMLRRPLTPMSRVQVARKLVGCLLLTFLLSI